MAKAKPTTVSEPRIWFHGTNYDAARKIRRQGFLPGTHFARALEDALEFGGNFVFEVVLRCEPRTPGLWQMVVGVHVPATHIVRIRFFDHSVLEEYPRRRRALFGKGPRR